MELGLQMKLESSLGCRTMILEYSATCRILRYIPAPAYLSQSLRFRYGYLAEQSIAFGYARLSSVETAGGPSAQKKVSVEVSHRHSRSDFSVLIL